MNFLTKFFIVLHVVLTMLFVAATIVFVNRVEANQAALKAANDKTAAEARRAGEAEAALATERSDALAVKSQAAVDITRMREQRNKDQADLRARDVQLATAQQEKSSIDARLQAAVSALKTAQATVDTLQKQLTDTRNVSDKTQQQNTELLTANADLNSKLQTARRALQNSNEEIESLKTELAGFRDAGPAGAARVAAATDPGSPTPTPNTELPINGIIRDQKTINGVAYATISVGTADNVTKGMVFHVIDREGGDFLGYLTVDRVEPNEASGRLEGPKVADMKPGNEVRTQL